MGDLPKKYVPQSLSKSDKAKQTKDIKETSKKYKEGKKLTKEDFSRPKVDMPERKSSYVEKFKDKYDMKVSIPAISKRFGISEAGLRKVFDKGVAAFLSSGSRPNQTASSWAYARVASVLMGGPAREVDKEIVKEYNIPKL
jgi:hypothetical protein